MKRSTLLLLMKVAFNVGGMVFIGLTWGPRVIAVLIGMSLVTHVLDRGLKSLEAGKE